MNIKNLGEKNVYKVNNIPLSYINLRVEGYLAKDYFQGLFV